MIKSRTQNVNYYLIDVPTKSRVLEMYDQNWNCIGITNCERK